MLEDVTLVIPVRNEDATIALLWDSIREQTCQPARIIFVDGGSNDQTVRMIRDLAAADTRITLIETSGAMPGEGRNIGIAAASTSWILLTDAGIRLSQEWVANLIRSRQANPELEVIYGTYEPIISSFFEECAAVSYVPQRWSSPITQGRPLRGPTITSTLMRRDVWAAVGGFPSWRAAEDLIFMRQVEKAGFRIGYAPDAVVNWRLSESLPVLFRKFRLYSLHNVRAGLQAEWHYGIARHYLAYAACLIAALLTGFSWLLAAPILGYLLRALRSLVRKREFAHGQPFILWAGNPIRVGLIMMILLTIDLATFTGWIDARWSSQGQTLSQ
ncbi:MAG: glycosyltransferase [Acidobacteriota bacterium]